MTGKTIEIIVGARGETSVQTRGFAGRCCCEASKFLEEALGERLSEKLTAEFHHSQAAQQIQQQRS